VGSMAAMLVVASDKTIVIEAAAQDQSELSADSIQNASGELLLLTSKDALENCVCIPLEEGTKAEQVTVENRYMEQELWIYIKNANEDFYGQNRITGDMSEIQKGWYEVQEDGILLKFGMDTVWEYHSTMESGTLKVVFSNPRDSYQQIVVLDPMGGGSESGAVAARFTEKELTLQVAKLVQKNMVQPDIKIYITRSEDIQVTDEQKLELVEAVEPDLFLQIGVSEAQEDAAQYGIQTYYNNEYYIPEFGNVEWADMVTKEVTVAVSNRALGLLPVEEESILKQLDMPAARLHLGYFTNAQEAALLKQEGYQDKLAVGIAEAILEVYANTY